MTRELPANMQLALLRRRPLFEAIWWALRA